MSGYFIIREKLPSLNDVINKNRANKYLGAKFKAEIEQTISQYILEAKIKRVLKPIDEPVVLYINWHEKTKRRDADNIQSSQKFILDALQKCGIIPNDSRKYVKQVYHKIIDATKDYVTVEIEPYEA